MFSSEDNVVDANIQVLEDPPRNPPHEAPAATLPLPAEMNVAPDLAAVAVPIAPDGDLLIHAPGQSQYLIIIPLS